MTMEPKPKVMPSICGTVRRKPKFAADAVTSTTFGPGVSVIATANSTSGPSKLVHATRIARMRSPCLNYLACTYFMLFRTARILRAHDHERAGCARSGRS